MATRNYYLENIESGHGWKTRNFYPAEDGRCYCHECCGHSLPLNHTGNGKRNYSGENIPVSIFVEKQHRIPDVAVPEYGFGG